MKFLELFREFLLLQNPPASESTVKNYLSDISKFIEWFENNFKKKFVPEILTSQIITQYKSGLRNANEEIHPSIAKTSIERRLSSLRKFSYFLTAKKYLQQNPFLESQFAPSEQEKDDWFLKGFKNHLYLNKSSHLTIKNYIIDVRQFLSWVSKVTQAKDSWKVKNKNIFSYIDRFLIEEYTRRLLNQGQLSPISVNRKLSSLRQYLRFLNDQKIIQNLPIFSSLAEQQRTTTLPYQKQYNNNNIYYPAENKSSFNQDALQIAGDSEYRYYSNFAPIRLMQKTKYAFSLLFDNVFIAPIVKISDQIAYFFWKLKGKEIFLGGKSLEKTTSLNQRTKLKLDSFMIGNIKKDIYAPLQISIKSFRFHKKIWFHMVHTRPNWYKKYHDFAFVHYLHFGILIIGMSIIGYSFSQTFNPHNRQTDALASSQLHRIISFRGKLTDTNNTPLTNVTPVRFAIYDDAIASGSALLWEESQTIKPDSNGIFQTDLGKTTPLPNSTPFQNHLYVGVSIGSNEELHPRQEIATVSLATNANMVNGLAPITETNAGFQNVLLALDSAGNLNIGGPSTTFQATDGSFNLSGQPLYLSTNPGSSGNIVLNPDGLGVIDFQKPIQNTSKYNTIPGLQGAVEVDDTLAISATTSSQPALLINQNSTGVLLSASSSGTAKFVLDNIGNASFAGDVAANGGNITSSQPTVNLFDNNTINLGASSSAITIGSTLGKTTIQNKSTEILGDLTISGKVGQTFSATDSGIIFSGNGSHVIEASVGTVTLKNITVSGNITVAQDTSLLPQTTGGNNNLGSASLPWDTIYVNNIVSPTSGTFGFWQRNNGSIYPSNISDNVIIGGTSPSNALIQLLSSGTDAGSASLAANINFTGSATKINQLNGGPIIFQTSPGGNNLLASRLTITNEGKIGIGTTQPTSSLEITSPSIGPNPLVSLNRSGNGTLVDFKKDGSSEGSITVNGNTVSYNAFTGSHYVLAKDPIVEGMLVSLTGQTEYLHNNKDAEIIYGVTKSQEANSPTILGTYLGLTKENSPIGTENPQLAMAVGNGDMWVVDNGMNIKPGEYLISSSLAGHGMLDPGIYPVSNIIARAAEPVDWNEVTDTVSDNGTIRKHKKISVLFGQTKLYNLSFKGNLLIVQNQAKQTSSDDQYALQGESGAIINSISGFAKASIANLEAGAIKAKDVVVENAGSFGESVKTPLLIAENVSTNSISIAGTDLKDYIINLIQTTQNNNKTIIISPIVNADEIHTNIISPLASDTVVINGKLSISHSTSSQSSTEIALQVQGNASVSGQLQTNNLTSDNASISGTLRAKKIIADEIVGQQASTGATYITNIYQASSSGQETALLSQNTNNQSNSNSSNPIDAVSQTQASTLAGPQNQAGYLDIASISGQLASVPNLKTDFANVTSGLTVFGPSSLTDTAISGTLSISNGLLLANNTINVLGANLELQPLRQGNVSFMADLVTIDTNGNLDVKGNASFAKDVSIKGTLATNIISPLPEHDLVINLKTEGNGRNGSTVPSLPSGSSLIISNASNSGVLTITQFGDLIASGSGKFTDLASKTFTIVRGAQADTSLTETLASASAGTAIILKGQKERTIITPFVKTTSLIYLTPASDTGGQAVYIARQTVEDTNTATKGSFTIEIPLVAKKNITVNWWIIN